MKKYQRMHLIFIRQYIKQIMEYKVDFVVGVLGVFLTQGLNLLFLNVIFQHIPSLEGWTFQEIAFIYGFSLIPKGLDHLFFDNLWALGQRLVRKGEFDKYLTRPINPLFHILVETFQIDALGELLVGGILLATTATSIAWTLPKFLIFLVCIPFATLIYTSSVFHLLLYHIGNITIFRIFNISPFITGKEYTKDRKSTRLNSSHRT